MSDLSRVSLPDTLDLRSTPPTSEDSSSSTSSQPTSLSDRDSADLQKEAAGNAPILLSRADIVIGGAIATAESRPELASTRMTVMSTTTTAGSVHVAAGMKRTASGEVKVNTSPPLAGAVLADEGHRQQKAGNLSSELRARLSYAMMKVQHGWEKRTLDEVETIVTQTVSPTTTSPFRRPSKGSNSDGYSSHSSRSSPSDTINRVSATPGASQEESGSQGRRTIPAGKGYESFWKEHSTNNTAAKIMQARALTSVSNGQTSAQNGGLLPAPTLYTGPNTNPRRVEQQPYQSQPWQEAPKLSNGLSNSSFLSTTTIPQTPPQHLFSRERGSPSEKSTIEQDAVETLLFMSSPGSNVVHHFGSMAAPPQRPPQSASRGKDVEQRTPGLTPGSRPGHNRSQSQSSQSSRATTATGVSRFQQSQTQARNLDKMLDDMIEQMGDQDGSSDEDDEQLDGDVAMPLVSPARPVVHT